MKVDSEGPQRKALKARKRGRQEVAPVHFASRLNPQSASAISNYGCQTSPSRCMALRKPETIALSQRAEATLITC